MARKFRMTYLLKSQREARKRHQETAQKIREAQLTIMCIDFGNFMLEKLQKNGILEQKIQVTEQDVREFAESRN